MNKEELNQKLSDLEAEAEKLRSLINAPEQRAPEAGDVYLTNSDVEVVYSGMLPNGYTGLYVDGYPSGLSPELINDRTTYLGKFDEVYVKISDVQEALSIKDENGFSIGSFLVDTDEPSNDVFIATSEALCKLNIITD